MTPITLSNVGLVDKLKPPPTKICNTCKKEKPIKSFYKNDRSKHGRVGECTECRKEYKQQKKADKEEYAKEFFVF